MPSGREYVGSGQKARDEKKAGQAGEAASAAESLDKMTGFSAKKIRPTPSAADQASALRESTPTPSPSPTASPRDKYNKYKQEGGRASYEEWLASR